MIGALTSIDQSGVQPSAPTFHDRLSFAGDGAYPTGGTVGLEAAIQKLRADGRALIAVIGQDCGGYVVTYDEVNDKLKVWTTPAGGGVLVEVANAANLSAVTFNIVAISQ
jgi:hypothetical protein